MGTLAMSKDREKNRDYIFSSFMRSNDFSLNDIPKGREFLGALASWAGKGKDELVQLICREIGVATAALLKEPLSQVMEGKKIKFTIELVPDDEKEK